MTWTVCRPQPTNLGHIRLTVKLCLQWSTTLLYQFLPISRTPTRHTPRPVTIYSPHSTNRGFNNNNSNNAKSSEDNLFGPIGHEVTQGVQKRTIKSAAV